jgi:hypothetical protein
MKGLDKIQKSHSNNNISLIYTPNLLTDGGALFIAFANQLVFVTIVDLNNIEPYKKLSKSVRLLSTWSLAVTVHSSDSKRTGEFLEYIAREPVIEYVKAFTDAIHGVLKVEIKFTHGTLVVAEFSLYSNQLETAVLTNKTATKLYDRAIN